VNFTAFRRLAWDLETTGVDVQEARIVTAAIVVRGAGRDDHTFSYLINPGVPIPAAATEVHGITDERAQAEGGDPRTALDQVAGHLAAALAYGMPVIAFNQAFDWSVLHHELARHQLPTMGERLEGADPITLIDPHVLDKQLAPRVSGSGQRKLGPTCERYGVTLTDWHTAEDDALAALLLADAQFTHNPQLADMSPAQLYRAQRAWRAEQQADLQEYLRRTRPGVVCAPQWPLLPAETGGERLTPRG
jgi:DNA polymerase-3 subunit epsilon